MNQAELADIQAKKDKEKLDGYSAGWIKVPKIIQKHIDKLKEASDESQRQADLLHEQIFTNQKLLELYTEQNRLSEVKADKKKTLDDLDAEISRLENANLLLEAEGERTDDIYKNNQKINSLKKERLGVEILIKGNAEAQDKIALKTLDAERAAAKIANDRRVAELKLEYTKLEYAREYSNRNNLYIETLNEAIHEYKI